MASHGSRLSAPVPGAGRRVLLAVHGHEPADWWLHASRALAGWSDPSVLVLAVVDVPAPTRTSPGSAARRACAAARGRWRQLGEARVEATVETLLRALPAPVEVTRLVARRSDPGRTVAEVAAEWGADVVVVGPHRPGGLARLLLGAVHERVVRYAPCSVLVTPPAGDGRRLRGTPRSGARVSLVPQPSVPATEGA
jgi:nucleotide-binding universal stress UspA family protein